VSFVNVPADKRPDPLINTVIATFLEGFEIDGDRILVCPQADLAGGLFGAAVEFLLSVYYLARRKLSNDPPLDFRRQKCYIILETPRPHSAHRRIANATKTCRTTTDKTFTEAGFDLPVVTIAISDTVRRVNRGAGADGAPQCIYLPLLMRP
jgi:hypothetical protein